MDKIQFPYGTTDFYRLITEGEYYIDRTNYIPLLEDHGIVLLFLRPPRFGKSLLLSMLENYYDVKKAAEFDRLFGHLAIGQNPTPRRNSYFVLHWDFSAVQTSGTADQVLASLYQHINDSVQVFKSHYQDMLDHEIELDERDGLGSLYRLLAITHLTSYPVYLFIDEYDHFANEVLSTQRDGDQERYQELLDVESVFKTILKVVKALMEGRGMERVFLTGVLPNIVQDMTSGFNISRNISSAYNLNELCGFREAEIVPLLEQVGSVWGFSHAQVQEALHMLRTFYGGYRFVAEEPTSVYNPSLVLSFLKHLQETGQYPGEMLDTNMSRERQKIAYIAHLPDGKQLIANAMNDEEPLDSLAMRVLEENFGVYNIYHRMEDYRRILSLLCYFGVLTLSDQLSRIGAIMFIVPNQVTRQLYLEYLRELLFPQAADHLSQIAQAFMHHSDMATVCTFIEQTCFPLLNTPDYAWVNNLPLKTLFLTLFADTSWYLLDSEATLQQKYTDVVILVRPDMRQQGLLDFLLECKYLPLTDVEMSSEEVRGLSMADLAALPAVAAQQAAAQQKLAGYHATLHATYGEQLQLRRFSVVAVGFERLVWKEV
jgi:hypothetical protein